MTPKLLQKKSNRFLQLALPENLAANKRIGKREKYYHRPGVAANNLRGMEKRILGQWAFSWNMYKKRMEKEQSLPCRSRPENSSRISQFPPSLAVRFPILPFASPCFLVTPSLYILQERINRALGGNVIQYLKDKTGSTQWNHPSRLGTEENTLEHSVSFFWRGQETPRSTPPSGKKPQVSLEALLSCSARFISSQPVHFGHHSGELVTEHCRKNNFNMIYSLLAVQILQNKTRGDRRDRIADHYRNQLAEWRKISFIYGGLPLKAARRFQRRAHLLGGDVDSNFLSLLESRLDVTLQRAFFFSTLKEARQWIQRGKIYVNNQRCTLSGTLLQPADIVTISPGATMEWRKDRLRAFALIREGADKWNKRPAPSRWGVGFQPRGVSSYRATDWERQISERRFPFSPSLMRKWKKWSQTWSNSPDSFLQKHIWRTNHIDEQICLDPRNDRFTGKGGQRAVSSTQSFYSSSALANYLSAFSREIYKGRYKAILDPQINADSTRQSRTSRVAPRFSLLERRQTYITSLICGLPPTTLYDRKGRPLPPPNPLYPPRFNKPQWQGVRHNKIGHRTNKAELTPPLFIRLGQLIGAEKTGRCQWLHQRQSNVVDGLHASRWNRGFAKSKSQREKKDQWRWSCIKPLNLECSYKLGTVIFLFFPQKLAWPSSINVSLLRKKLGG